MADKNESSEGAKEQKLSDSVLSRVLGQEKGLSGQASVGGSGINPFGPVVERRRATYEWLSNLNPQSH